MCPRAAAFFPLLGVGVLLSLSACGDSSKLAHDADFGGAPTLLPASPQSLPTIHIAKAVGWPSGRTPVAASGLKVQAFAEGLEHPRWLYTLPNGDVLVAETNAPADRPDDSRGIAGKITRLAQKRAGAGVPSANRISLLRDADGDGRAEIKTVFLKNLNSPFGMVLVGDQLYVADTDALMRFTYVGGALTLADRGTKVLDLPAGSIDHHWTKNVIASRDGRKLFITVGSNSNAAENGIDVEEGRARILELDIASGKVRPFSTGLRNPNGMSWQPQSGTLWVAVNERDALGSDLVPDYITSVKDGAFYGWPYSYYGQHLDPRIKAQRPDLVATALAPDFAVGAHTASLSMMFYEGGALPVRYTGGAFVSQHGSWDRKPFAGYKVIFIPFANGAPSGEPEDFLTGFLDSNRHAQGRPVGLAADRAGALLVADDVGNTVWRIAPAAKM